MLRINDGNYSDFHLSWEPKLVLWAAKLRLFMRNYRFLDAVFVQEHCSQSCSCIIRCSESALMPRSTWGILFKHCPWSGVYINFFLTISEPDSTPHCDYSTFLQEWVRKQKKSRDSLCEIFQIPLTLLLFLASERELLLSDRCTGWAGDLYLGGEGQKCPRPLVFGHHEAHKLTQVCRLLRPIMLRDKLCRLLKAHCSGKKMQLTLAMAAFNLIFIKEKKHAESVALVLPCTTGATALAAELAGRKHSWYKWHPTGSLPLFLLPLNKTAPNAIIKSHGMELRSL